MSQGTADGSSRGRHAGPAERAGILAVHAHPDDETLATGALLATWAAAGLPVTVVTATRGERGEVIGRRWAHLAGDGAALAAHRERELAAALRALGVSDHVFLDRVRLPSDEAALGGGLPGDGAPGPRYEDSGMVWAGAGRATRGAALPPGALVSVPLDEVAARLVAVLRDRRPAVVVTYDPRGGYGHPDHVRVHELTMRALATVRDDGPEPAVLWRRVGRSALAAACRALAGDAAAAALGAVRATLTVPDPWAAPPAMAVPDEDLTLAVPVAPVRAHVLDALRAHGTQVQAVRAVDDEAALVGCYALSNGVLAPLLPTEGYVQVAGPPVVRPPVVRPPVVRPPAPRPVA